MTTSEPAPRRELALPDGRVAVLRPASVDDAEGLVTLIRAQADDRRGMVITADQVSDASVFRARLEEQRARRERGELAVTWVAELDGALVAEGHIAALAPARLRHVAGLALGVHPGAQRLGLGRAVLHALLDAAHASGTVRVELRVRADNVRARALYRSAGFSDESVFRQFVRLDDGTFVDDVGMVRFLTTASVL